MKVMVVILWLSVWCVNTQAALKLDMTGPRDVKSFCEIMQNPKLFQDKPITLEATGLVLEGGVLLTSDKCTAPDVSVHYDQDYERDSNAAALQLFQRFQRQAHEAHLRSAGIKAEQTIISVVFEGQLEKNPYYHVRMDRGPATLAAWDFNYEYAFVISRMVELRRLS